MTTAEVLREARALYEAGPWHSRIYPPPDSHCFITAVNAVAKTDAERNRANGALYRAVGRGGLAEFTQEHTTEEVLAAFDRAIEAVS